MSLYFLPALIALAVKLYILVYVLGSQKRSNSFVSLIIVFACHNAIELIGYIRFLDGVMVENIFRTYYVATIFLIMLLPMNAFSVTNINNKVIKPVLMIVASLLTLLVVFTDLVVAGSYSIGYSLTASMGEYYFVFALYVVIALFCNIIVLLFGYNRKSSSELDSVRSLYNLIALTPLLFICLIVVTFKVLGITINGAGLLPIGTTLFLIIMLKGESKHKLIDIRRLLPFSREKKSATEFIRLMDTYSQNVSQSDSFNILRNGIERQAILYTLGKCDNNISKAARMMGLPSRSTLYSMMLRLDIDYASVRSE